MAKYRKKPVVIEATQWFKSGDHPDDYATYTVGMEGGKERVFTGTERKSYGWEGDVVRHFNHPSISGSRACEHCTKPMNVHGWIDTKEGGHIVCPGDFIVTTIEGERYPCKPDIFAETYDLVVEAAGGTAQEDHR
jgi:hypothetical protein